MTLDSPGIESLSLRSCPSKKSHSSSTGRSAHFPPPVLSFLFLSTFPPTPPPKCLDRSEKVRSLLGYCLFFYFYLYCPRGGIYLSVSCPPEFLVLCEAPFRGSSYRPPFRARLRAEVSLNLGSPSLTSLTPYQLSQLTDQLFDQLLSINWSACIIHIGCIECYSRPSGLILALTSCGSRRRV